jgi:hypothetical protein
VAGYLADAPEILILSLAREVKVGSSIQELLVKNLTWFNLY